MNQHKRIERTCVTCGQRFGARAADVRRGFGRACSRRCGGNLNAQGQRLASRAAEAASNPFQMKFEVAGSPSPACESSTTQNVNEC
jgi:hypothetical protein